MRYLGIDLGSSSIKGAVLDGETLTVQEPVSVPFPAPVEGLPANWFEVSPSQILDAVQRLLDVFRRDAREIHGLVLSSQMGGVVLADQSGNAVTNYLSWRDQRVLQSLPGRQQSCFDELLTRTSSSQRQKIGQELKPGGAVSLLYWLVQTGQLRDTGLRPLSIGDYLLAKLTDAPPAAERTLALGLIDLNTNGWATDWFQELGFGFLDWPPLVDTGTPIGSLNWNGRKIPVLAAVGDHQAALAGSTLEPGELSINVSTGSQVSQVTTEWLPGNYQTRPYFGGRFLNTITHLPAGRALNGLLDLLLELPRAAGVSVADPWNLITQAVTRTPTSTLDVNLAFFASAMGNEGWVQNIHLEELTIGHLFRSAFENMADNYLSCARRLSPDLAFSRAVLSGGLPHKVEPLRAAISAQFPFPSRTVSTPEETLQGLLNLASANR